MSEAVIKVENISKSYLVGHQSAQREGYSSFRDVIVRETRDFGRKVADMAKGRQIVQGDYVEEFWALSDVNFDIREGEVVGVIGRNGAGKSTLLKILSHITEPTKGRVRLRGRVASLLEVGTGFHPELTGRENIFLNGTILGMTAREIRRKFDEIVAFAEVERFLDTPVKRFSSGMYVRLAFAVAAYLEPEILIVDEVLAVGDHEFQQKCLGKMKAVSAEGRTVLFVSHNMLAVRTMCDRGIVLSGGRTIFDGKTVDAIDTYSNLGLAGVGVSWTRPATLPISTIGFKEISSSIEGVQPFLKLACHIKLQCQSATQPTFIAINIRDQMSAIIMQAIPDFKPYISGKIGVQQLEIEIQLPGMVPGVYYIDFWIGYHFTRTADHILSALSFEVKESPVPDRNYPHPADHGSIVPFCSLLSHTESYNE
jgi:lipopolysaccharide transport system ATP-binding protein